MYEGLREGLVVNLKLALQERLRRKARVFLPRHPRLERIFRGTLAVYHRAINAGPLDQWLRVVMNRETEQFVSSLPYRRLDALEISGRKWQEWEFASYRSTSFPGYDVCEKPLEPGAFDIIFAEQVLEHVPWPSRAARNLWEMLRTGGVLVVDTPFLVRVHEEPIDCARWTETGLQYLLAEAGFELSAIRTGSWGNRACLRANFWSWRRYRPWHSLRNEPAFPLVVWAFARKGL